MCPIPRDTAKAGAPNNVNTKNASSTCFSCKRLNDSTFQIVEDDKWDEIPIIYAKIYDTVLVLIDTGCGGAAKDDTAALTSLRKFLETYPVPDNNGTALNPGSEKGYLVICSHCHFDHIGGIAQFLDTPKCTLWASSYGRAFVEGDGVLPMHSLCQYFGMKTPEYKVTVWAEDGQNVIYGPDNTDLGLVIYHTPGHTPDELAIWDSRERVLFVGDTMYEWSHIVWPLEGNLLLYSQTMGKLKNLVRSWNNEIRSTNDDGEQLLGDVDLFLYHVSEGIVEENPQGTFRDEQLVSYNREDGKINFIGPKKLFEAFRSDETAMDAIRKRHS
ncbi:hypothetical protein DL767_001451 [Monosporascus sp. MG133]|nr:hypothetical protein DL767_001451 [Monosporascus sp. MG133]